MPKLSGHALLVSPIPQFLGEGNPIGSVCFVIEPEREPFGLIPPLYPEGLEKHGPPRLYSAFEATSSVSCLNRVQSTCPNGVLWLCSCRAFSTTSYAIHPSSWKRNSRKF